jgi:hypothetical protein
MTPSTFGDTHLANQVTIWWIICNCSLILSIILASIGISVYVHTLRFVIRSTKNIPRSKWTAQQIASSRLLMASRGMQFVILYLIIVLPLDIGLRSLLNDIGYMVFQTCQVFGIYASPLLVLLILPSSATSSSSIPSSLSSPHVVITTPLVAHRITPAPPQSLSPQVQ